MLQVHYNIAKFSADSGFPDTVPDNLKKYPQTIKLGFWTKNQHSPYYVPLQKTVTPISF